VKVRRSLFWIISRIREYPWIDPLLNTIVAPHNHSIGMNVDEIIVEQEAPDSVHELVTTMGQNALLLSVPFGMNLFEFVLE
jgi:hypothetical protein